MVVIGLSGKAGVGKDYITKHFLNPAGYTQISMAWPMKVGLIAKGQTSWEEVFVTKPPHIRKLMQIEGTERHRDVYGQDYWCMWIATWLRLMAADGTVKKVVIPDIRFRNEAEMIHELKGKVYRVIAPDRESIQDPVMRQHRSEIDLDWYKFDGHIYNNPGQDITLQLHQLGLL